LRDLPAKKWYRFLPTRDNKLLEEYLKDWARLNMAVINEARVVNSKKASISTERQELINESLDRYPLPR